MDPQLVAGTAVGIVLVLLAGGLPRALRLLRLGRLVRRVLRHG